MDQRENCGFLAILGTLGHSTQDALMSGTRRLDVGVMIVSAVDCGAVVRGQPGMIQSMTRRPRLLWWRGRYCCVFLGGVTAILSARQIEKRDHGFSPQILEHPYWFLHTREAACIYLPRPALQPRPATRLD